MVMNVPGKSRARRDAQRKKPAGRNQQGFPYLKIFHILASDIRCGHIAKVVCHWNLERGINERGASGTLDARELPLSKKTK